MPGIFGSIFLVVVGAITRYAYSDSVWQWHSGGHSHSVQLDTVGLILIWAGLVGLLLSIVLGLVVPRYTDDDYLGHHLYKDDHLYEEDEIVDETTKYQSKKNPIKIVKRRRRY